MQAIIVTKDSLFSEAVTCAMLREMAVKLFGKSEPWLTEMENKVLKSGGIYVGKSKENRTGTLLTCCALRKALATMLGNSSDDEYGELWAKGELEVEFDHLPDLDISKAGANTKRASTGAAGPRKTGVLKGAYKVVKMRDMSKDEGKQAIWKHVWECTTFEDYFAKCPTKSMTSSTNRIISASSEIQWALKSGWIVPVTAE